MNISERLEKYSCPEPNTGCWRWDGVTVKGGYGRISVEGKFRPAHRVSYELKYGKIPDGLMACHKCDTPACINPDHIFLGSAMDNMHDKYRKGRAINPVGEAHGRAILTVEKVIEIKRLLATGIAYRKVAAIMKCGKGTVSDIKTGRTWAHVPMS